MLRTTDVEKSRAPRVPSALDFRRDRSPRMTTGQLVRSKRLAEKVNTAHTAFPFTFLHVRPTEMLIYYSPNFVGGSK